MNKKLFLSFIAGTILSLLFLWLAFKNVPLKEFLAYLSSIEYLWIFPSVAFIFISYGFRVLRWQIIICATHKVSFRDAWHPLMIGFMLNTIFPGRIGEMARPAILQKKSNVPFTTGLATVAAERIFDVVSLLFLFMLVLANINIDPDLSIQFHDIKIDRQALDLVLKNIFRLSFFLTGGIILVCVEKTRNIMGKIITGIPEALFFCTRSFKDKIYVKIAMPLTKILDNFALGFNVLKSPKNIWLCAGLSLCVWLCQAVSFYVFAFGCPGINISFMEMGAVLILVCFFIALPSVPGYWGVWEAGGIFALSLFGISPKDAAGFTLTNHGVQLFPVIIAGLVSAMATGINIMRISKKNRASFF